MKNNVIGSTEIVKIDPNYECIPAKVDTGADRSAIWASRIRVDKNGILRFALFGEGSQHYTGKIFKREDYGVAMVKSSNGNKEMRYRTHLTVTIRGRKIRTLFYLSDRSTQKYPVLIGRHTIRGKFIVDVKQAAIRLPKTPKVGYNDMMLQDPYSFFCKFRKNRPPRRSKEKSV